MVADDDVDIRLLVRSVIDVANEGLEVVAEAANGAEAIAIWRGQCEPQLDVLVLDNRMPGASGMEVAREVLRQRPEQLVVLHSAYLDDQVLAEAATLGIAMCVSKADVLTLPDVIRGLAAR